MAEGRRMKPRDKEAAITAEIIVDPLSCERQKDLAGSTHWLIFFTNISTSHARQSTWIWTHLVVRYHLSLVTETAGQTLVFNHSSAGKNTDLSLFQSPSSNSTTPSPESLCTKTHTKGHGRLRFVGGWGRASLVFINWGAGGDTREVSASPRLPLKL